VDRASAAGIVVGEIVAQRSTSSIHRARSSDGRRMIVKIAASSDTGAERRGMEREDAIVSRVQRPGLVATFGLIQIDGRPALLREDFGGRSLDQLVGMPRPLEQFLRIGVAAASALADVHAAGVVHRDVKPSNLIANESSGEVKVTDFGLALAPFLDRDAADGDVVGTLAYMAPEQTGRLGATVDHRADLYALGVTFYELLTGQLPFEGRDPLEWIHFHLARQPRPPSDVAPQIPAVVSSIVLKLLAKAPSERYQTADGARADLEECLREWVSSGVVAPFSLGRFDVGAALRVPRRLYGREREIQKLGGAFDATLRSASPSVVFVSGPAGIGKSSLVASLHAPTAAEGGAFGYGKFESLRRNVPYVAFGAAMEQLAAQLLAATGPRIAERKATLASAVANNARVLTDVFPALAPLFDELPAVAALGPIETQNRFQLVFVAFLQGVLAANTPLTLFLDDMQWADAPSLALIETMARGALRGPLMLVLAFRDDEVDASHPFSTSAARLRGFLPLVEDISLSGLDEATVTSIVADTLLADAATVAPLARLLVDKTAGNPFFVSQFLEMLHADCLLRFDAATRSWQWNLAEIEARGITNNVVSLLIGRIAKLPPATREALRIASCVGTEFDLGTLAIVCSGEPRSLATELHPAVENELVLLRHEAGKTFYRFRHDRVQQAAYAQVPPEERASVRLRIARLLIAALSEQELDAKLFDVVDHLDEGLALLSDPSERLLALKLNVRAGNRARAATAYAHARRYLSCATVLSTAAIDTFDIELALAECEYLDGALEAASKRFDALLLRNDDELRRARIDYLQIRLAQLAGDYRSATETAIRSFQRFGLDPPRTAAAAQTSCDELQRTARALLEGRSVESLLDAPLLTDDRLRALADLLESSGPPIYMVRPELFPWITLQLLVLSLEHGNCEASCYAYGIYALMRAAAEGDPDGGYAFAQLAIALNARLGDVRLRGCMLHLLGDHVNFWKHPFAADLPILDRGFHACLEGGDLIYSSYIAFQQPWHAYEAGIPLEEVWKLAERYIPFAARTHPAVHRTIRFEQQFVRDLQGLTVRGGSFGDGTFDEAEANAVIDAAQFGCGVVYREILSLIARYTFGDVEAALEAATRAEPVLGAAFSMPIQTSFVFYRGLASAAHARRAEGAASETLLRTAAADLAALSGWARGCAANFEDKAALLDAEIARATGRAADAIGLYERGISAARASGHVHVEALGFELAAEFYEQSGAASLAAAFVDEAIALYRRWGAAAKVAQLVARPRAQRESRALFGPAASTSSSSSSSQIDLIPVVKASQSLSEEMVLPALLQRLITIVVEYAGAQRGVLFLLEGGALKAAAEATVGGHAEVLGDAETAAPMSMLHYVERTSKPVILSDACLPNPFSSDPYLVARRKRSILCAPIVRHRRLTGVFFLENDLVASAFSPERLTVLDILAGQTAISIDNALLFAASQDAVRARDEFLSLASHELKTPLTPLMLKVQSLAAIARKGTLAELSPERLFELARTIDTQVSRLASLVDGMLDVSVIHTGRLSLDRRPIDLREVVADVAQSFSGAAISLDAPSPVVGRWDPDRVRQVVAALVGNAVRHAGDAPISVFLRADGSSAMLEVRDRGPGIPADELHAIFDRFVRKDHDTIAGLGLGLFIAREIVRAHGGEVSVVSERGEGSSFTVRLPLGVEG
jgi:predicted ATPase/signal transduction histidine kinase